VVNQKDKEK